MKKSLVLFSMILLSIATLAQSNTGQPTPAEREQPAPQGNNLIVTDGALGKLSLQTSLSTKLNEVGDEVLATLYEPVRTEDGRIAIPRGTQFFGKVSQVQQARKGQKESSLKITFENMLMPYGSERVVVTVVAIDDYASDEKYKSKDDEGKVGGGRDGGKTARNAGTGAGLGSLGGIFGGWTGMAIGAGVGAAAGVLMTRGKDLRLDKGTILRVRFERELKLPAFDEDNSGLKRIENK